MKLKISINRIFAILVILLIIFTPISLAQETTAAEKSSDINDETTDIVHYSDSTDPLESNAEEETSDFDFSIFNTDTLAQENPEIAQAVAASSIQPQAITPPKADTVNALNKFEPSGQYYTDMFTGSATYSFSLEVPPGVNGLEPSITLSYNHQQSGSRGILGSGWGLSQNFIYRNTEYTRSDASDDKFHLNLNGMNLELVYVPSEDKYRTEIESYLYVEKETGASNQKGEYWIVKTKDGTTYRFGYNADSEFVSNQENYVSMWYLDLVTDTHSNTISYTYLENPSPDQATYLSNIAYNNGANLITFNYNFNAQNGFDGYSYGTKIKQTALLNNIELKNSNKLVRKYIFDYDTTDYKKFLKKIRQQGSDGVSELPPIEFTYNALNKGWSENGSWTVPSEAYFGSDKDMGVRIFDINGDGFNDISKMYNSGNFEYWLNNKNGWSSKQTQSNPISEGFVNDLGQDQGVRFVDINGDTRVDMLQMLGGSSGVGRLVINKGNGWVQGSTSMPAGISFTERNVVATSCTPSYCSSGYTDGGVSCSGSTCTRTCSAALCSGSGSVVFTDTTYPEWNDNDYDEEDTGTYFYPQASKCYKFEYTGSSKTQSDDSQCYDLYTDDAYYSGDYDKDCDGRDLDAYAGIGFAGSKTSSTWLQTIPGDGSTYSNIYIGNVDNSYWRYKYLSRYGQDTLPDQGGSNIGDWDGFNYDICDEAGMYTIYCAPSYGSCSNWGKSQCGYGCANEGTSAFVVLGIYKDYNGNLWDALDDNEPGCSSSMVDDNDYFGYGTYKVTQYDTSTSYANQQCTFIPYDYKDTGVRAADVNSDGKTDMIKGTDAERRTWINTGTSWLEDSTWTVPSNAYFITSADRKDRGVRIADVNGDGMPDLVKGDTSTRITWINTGKGWAQDSTWVIPDGASFISGGNDMGVVLLDINGDSLSDIVKSDGSTRTIWINTGKGWTQDSSWTIPNDITLKGIGSAIDDINGDGMPDLIKATDASNRRTYTNNAAKAYLLTAIKNGLGGTIALDYKKIAELDNNHGDGISDLPFSGWVVSSITQNNGLSSNQIISTTSYDYSGGLYDSDEKEFRGFNYVQETLADGTITRHYFYQDKSKKGLEYSSEILDKNSAPYKKAENEISSEDKGGYYAVKLASTTDYTYDGNSANPKTAKTEFSYDSYGNMIKISYLGDTSAAGDEKYLYNEYLYNTNEWIIGNPKHTYLLDSNQNKVSESWFRYDNKDYDQAPTKGDLTYAEYWLSTGSNPTESLSYDSYGNVLSYINPRGYATTYSYDSTNTFLAKVTNAKGHQTSYNYDTGTGNLLSIIDPNSYKTEYVYDVFGRETKEILPYDSATYPTTEIQYSIDGTAPEETKMVQREESGTTKTYDAYNYYDGFGNIVQTKRESDSSQLITQDKIYDSMSRLKEETNPYFSNAGYTSPSTAAKKISYTYDTLSRIIKIINPDSTQKTSAYDHWNNYIYDENSNRKDFAYDAYGNIILVKEYNNGEIYTTSYAYDTSGNLKEITDSKNNKMIYTYDSLGIKIKLQDPDMGTWSYSYDSNGNLISQIDNKGNSISLQYDELDRITIKNAPAETINYYYDSGTIGAISRVQSSASDNNFNYDQRNRLINEQKIIAGTSFSTFYSYDTMDRLVSKTLPDSSIMSYSYGAQGQLKSINNILPNIDYNELGQQIQRVYNNGLATNLQYNSDNYRLSRLATSDKQDLSYSYDGAGNVARIIDAINSKTSSFQYDNLDRLTNAQRFSGSVEQPVQTSNILYQSDFETSSSIVNWFKGGMLSASLSSALPSPVNGSYSLAVSRSGGTFYDTYVNFTAQNAGVITLETKIFPRGNWYYGFSDASSYPLQGKCYEFSCDANNKWYFYDGSTIIDLGVSGCQGGWWQIKFQVNLSNSSATVGDCSIWINGTAVLHKDCHTSNSVYCDKVSAWFSYDADTQTSYYDDMQIYVENKNSIPQNVSNITEEKFNITYNYDSIGNIIQLISKYYNLSFSYGGSPVHAPASIIYQNITIEQFRLKDSLGNAVAKFDSLGNLWLKGTLTKNSAYGATSNDEFRFQDRNGNDVAIIDLTTGNMHIKGSLYEKQTTLNPIDYNFIIKDSNDQIAAFIDESGNIFLKGTLTQNRG
ncbi:MAG: toxin TcdB middle/N-terminal domain-containing protein [Candidatus Woesearchaeota archaeon]|nr:toxin TcdB middle/N-terminal domain-containing protein [Candidatus Woesearchaeota archaeon]